MSIGIAVSCVFHRALDANLTGLYPEYSIHISKKLLSIDDGAMLEQGIRSCRRNRLMLSEYEKYLPDSGSLAQRFSIYLAEQ